MPQTYVRTTNRASSYTRQQLLDAVEAVKNNSITAYAASKLFGIPRATIVNRVYGRKGCKSNTLGRPTVLLEDVEKELVNNLHVMEKYGFGLTRKETLEAVGQYVRANNIETPFNDGVPGEDWFLRFKKQHGLSVKKPQPVEYARKQASCPAVIYPYFDLLEQTIADLCLNDKPSHIWNADETSFSKDPTKSKVIGLQGYTSTRTISSPGKTNTTVLLACSASGDKAPPLIVYKGQNLWDQWFSENAYPGTVYAATTNGWMEAPVFEKWFEKVFLPTVGEKRPILLIYDGHSTHVGINIIQKARDENITILKIPPHTSHHLQPLDLAVNKSFKDKWDMALVKWQRLNIGKVMPKKDFARIIGQVWTQIEPRVCTAGFRKAGIYPLNKNAIPEDKFDQVLLSEWRERKIQSQNTNIRETNKLDSPVSSKNLIQDQDHTQKTEVSSIQHAPYKLSELTLATINKLLNKSQLIPTTSSKNIHVSLNKCVPISVNEVLQKQHIIVNAGDKVQILSNRPVNSNITFEQVLLNYIKPGGSSVKAKRRKVATGAEVITHDDVYERCKLMKTEQEKKNKKKEERTTKKKEKLNIKQEKSEKVENNNVNAGKNVIKKPKNKDVTQIKKSKQCEKQKVSKKGKKRRKCSVSSSENEYEVIYDDESNIDCEEFFARLRNEEDEENIERIKNPGNVKNYIEVVDDDKENCIGRSEKISKAKKQTDIMMNDRNDDENIEELADPVENITRNSRNDKKYIIVVDDRSENYIDLTEKTEKAKEQTEFIHSNEHENIEESENEIRNINDCNARFSENDWVLVKYTAKKSIKHYVGIILQINEEGFPVDKYATKKFKSECETVFTFPLVEDISVVKHISDIVSKLPQPLIGRRGQINFKMSFIPYNVQ